MKDHASSDEWHASEEEAINTLGAVRINSVGWLYNEDDESYILASTISLDDAHVTNLIRILKGTVVATKIIRKARNGKATEVQILRLRQPSLNEPAELIVGDSKSHSVFILRPSQLKQLAYDE